MSDILNEIAGKFKSKNKEALLECIPLVVDQYLAEIVAKSENKIDDVAYAAAKETIKKILTDLAEKI